MSFSTKNDPAIGRMHSLGPVFGATDKELARVVGLTYEFTAPQGTVVITEGDAPQGFFLIVSGRVEMSVAGIACEELGPGMFFGETAMLDRGMEPATVTTLAPSVMRVASRREFRELILTERIAYTLMHTLAARQRVALENGRLAAESQVESCVRATRAEVVRT